MKQPLRLGEGMLDEPAGTLPIVSQLISRRSIRVRQIHKRVKTLRILVGATGFEPATPCAQSAVSRCSATLCETSIGLKFLIPQPHDAHSRMTTRPPNRSAEPRWNPQKETTFAPVVGHDPCFKARIGAVGASSAREKAGSASAWAGELSGSTISLVECK
jgi:hypothetical protein